MLYLAGKKREQKIREEANKMKKARKNKSSNPKAIEICYLTGVEGANLNSAGTEGVISVLKKTTDISGDEFVRVSGQSVKYQIRQIWKGELGIQISPVKSRGAKGKVIISEGNPVKYIDDDLFGYMIATPGGKLEKKRTGVVRTNGMISLFPFKGDRDFAVRYDPNDPAGKHNIYEVEVTTNVMRGNFFVEIDRLGVFGKTELGGKKDGEIPKKVKEDRIQALFNAVFNYSGGAHLSNYFTKAYPEIITVAILKRKLPVIGDKLVVTGKKKENGKYIIDKDRLKEAIETFEDNIEELLIGGFETVIENWNEIKGLANARIKVLSLKDMRKEISEKNFLV